MSLEAITPAPNKVFLPLLGVARPVALARKGPRIKLFPGGEGHNNCPQFYYVRDGFGCTFKCDYCYLRRQEFRHPDGAEYDPDFPALYKEVARWLRHPGELALLLGEVTDAWGWAHLPEILARNLELIEMFRAQRPHTLLTLTKDGHVMKRLQGVAPTDRVVLSWSLNPPAVAELYEMGAHQARLRLNDAVAARQAGWRVRIRIDPMIPIAGWQEHYSELAEFVARLIRPERVTVGSWRPMAQDPMRKIVPAELAGELEPGPDGRLRLRNRLELYQHVWKELEGNGIERALCKEELDVEAALYTEFGVTTQSCQCVSAGAAPISLLPWQALIRRKSSAMPSSSPKAPLALSSIKRVTSWSSF